MTGDWTIEFMLFKDAANNNNTHSQTQQTLIAIGDATLSTGGLWLYYDIASGEMQLVVTANGTALNSASGSLQSTVTTMFADNTWQFVALTKSAGQFTAYVNGIQVLQGTIDNTAFQNQNLYIGNIPGKSGTLNQFRSNEQGQYFVDNLRVRNRAVTPTVPNDVTNYPIAGEFSEGFTWTDTTWFSTYTNKYDYIDYVGWGLKIDKNSDAARLGTQTVQTNTQVGFTRTAIVLQTGLALNVNNTGFGLAEAGFQNLDFDDADTAMTQDSDSLSYLQDVWSSRTATVPSPGSQKLRVTAVVKDRYFFKVTPTIKIDNIQELTLNQQFVFTTGCGPSTDPELEVRLRRLRTVSCAFSLPSSK